MKRLQWELLHALRSMGLPGWGAIALALTCAIVWWAGLSPLREETIRLAADSQSIERRLTERGARVVASPLTPQQQLAAFETRFSGEKSITPTVARLHELAKRQGVQLDQAEFKFASEARDPLARYSIVLPVKADYRALRRFTREALIELPGLAMEEVNLRRTDPRSPQLEAQLRFVLFITKPS